jgi:hypothetical protein
MLGPLAVPNSLLPGARPNAPEDVAFSIPESRGLNLAHACVAESERWADADRG